jgi:uncharacterized protein
MSIPIPRELDVDLSQIPRHWMAGNAVATAIANGVNVLFPHGERFFVRSVNHYLDLITDPELRAQVIAFFKQEGHHARAHDRYNDTLRAHGFEIDSFLRRYKAVSSWLEAKLPAKLNLAGTAAAEHYTAILAHGAFTKGMLDASAPGMRELLAWHAAEEIEHKAVAYDVLQQIDPSYALRIAGLAYATVMLASFWAAAARMLMRQDNIGLRDFVRQLRTMGQAGKREPIIRHVFLAGIRQYIRRDFHPSQTANYDLAAGWFASHGLSFTTEAA